MKGLWIVGSGGHAKVVIDTARATGEFKVLGCLDDDPGRFGQEVLGVPVVGPISPVTIREHAVEYAVVAIGSNVARRSIVGRFATDVSWVTLVHPRASVAASVRLGEGTVVFAGAVVQPDVHLGRHVIVNTSASVDHDSRLGDWVHIGPGAHLAGNVTIGEGTFLGIGSRVIPGVRVGDWSTIGAGSTVIDGLPSKVTAVGTPARVINRHQTR